MSSSSPSPLMTPEQVQLVKSTAPVLKEKGTDITKLFYHNLLKAHPSLNNYFNLRNQVTGTQPTALAHAVLAYASHIDDLGKLGGAVQHIANKHASLFVRPEHYPIVGEFLVGAFGEVLGAGLTTEVKEAWIAAYNQLAQIFIDVEAGLYKEAGEWQNWRKFKIVRKEPETDSITSFYLKPVDGESLPSFKPGQYVSLQIPLTELGDLKQSRQFSLSEGAPLQQGQPIDHYRVSVKREFTLDNFLLQDLQAGKVPGVISNRLHKLYDVGDEVELSPPHGDFHFDTSSVPADVPVVLLSAGVGATPVVSILQSIISSPSTTSPARTVTWAHAAHDCSGVCFAEYVKDAARKNPNVTTRIFLKNVASTDKLGEDYHYQGPLDLGKLEQDKTLHLDSDAAQYFICGPEDWMIKTRALLKSKEIPRERVHVELFRTGDL